MVSDSCLAVHLTVVCDLSGPFSILVRIGSYPLCAQVAYTSQMKQSPRLRLSPTVTVSLKIPPTHLLAASHA